MPNYKQQIADSLAGQYFKTSEERGKYFQGYLQALFDLELLTRHECFEIVASFTCGEFNLPHRGKPSPFQQAPVDGNSTADQASIWSLPLDTQIVVRSGKNSLTTSARAILEEGFRFSKVDREDGGWVFNSKPAYNKLKTGSLFHET